MESAISDCRSARGRISANGPVSIGRIAGRALSPVAHSNSQAMAKLIRFDLEN